MLHIAIRLKPLTSELFLNHPSNVVKAKLVGFSTSVMCAVGLSASPPVSEGLCARFGGLGHFAEDLAKQVWPTEPSKIISLL